MQCKGGGGGTGLDGTTKWGYICCRSSMVVNELVGQTDLNAVLLKGLISDSSLIFLFFDKKNSLTQPFLFCHFQEKKKE